MDLLIRSLEGSLPFAPFAKLWLAVTSSFQQPPQPPPSLPPDRTSWSSWEHNGSSLQPLIAWAWKWHHYVKMGIVLLLFFFSAFWENRPKFHQQMVKAEPNGSCWIWGKMDGKSSSEKISIMTSGWTEVHPGWSTEPQALFRPGISIKAWKRDIHVISIVWMLMRNWNLWATFEANSSFIKFYLEFYFIKLCGQISSLLINPSL